MARIVWILLAVFLLASAGRGQTPRCSGPSYAQFHRDEARRDVRLTCLVDYSTSFTGEGLLLGGMIDGDIYLSLRSAANELIWEQTFVTGSESTELTTLNALLVDKEGMIAGVGSVFRDFEQHAFIFRFDPLAQQLLYLREATFESDPNTLLQSADGNYVVSGARLDFPAPYFLRAYHQRLDRDTGTPLEQGTLMDVDGDERIFDAVAHPAGGFVVTGQVVKGGGAGSVRTMIARMDEQGNLTDAIGGPAAREANARLFGYDIEVVGDRIYVLQWGDIGVLTGSLNTSPILTALDLEGNTQWTRRLDIAEYDGEVGLEMEPHNGGLLIYGYALGRERDIFLIHTTLEGSVKWANAYLFAGRVLLYVRANQQLLPQATGISLLATYVFNGERSHEGLLLQLDARGKTLSECVERRGLTVEVTQPATRWQPVNFVAELFDANWPDRSAVAPSPLRLSLTDDCDIPCRGCSVQTFSTSPLCVGDSVLIGGSWRTEAGLYRDTLTTAAGDCDSIVLTQLFIAPPIEAAYTQLGSCGLPTAEVVLEVNGGVPPYAFTWSAEGAAGDRPLLSAGDYSVTITDSLGCTPLVVPVVIDLDRPSFEVSVEAPSCFGGADGSIELIPAGAGMLRLTQDSLYRSQLTDLPTGSYPVIVRMNNGCEVFREAYVPEATISGVDLIGPAVVTFGRPTLYRAQPKGRDLLRDYQWNPTDRLSCTNCQETTAILTSDTLLRIVATDQMGCTVADSLFVRVLKRSISVYVPSAFSPNNDGINDTWLPGLGPEVSELLSWRVYNRWGSEVWAYDPSAEGFWTGGDAGAGVYLYHMTVRLIDGTTSDLSGEVTLLR